MADPSTLHGLVDMGSNGIRFSITNLASPTSRSLPTLFQSRSGISLFEAQHDSDGNRVPIPQSIIKEVLDLLARFKTVCTDFEVPNSNISILATEATRTALNSDDLRRQIAEATGWTITMLSKEMEGETGAMGVASSFHEVEGLVMDLGGGSTQITWIIAKGGIVQTSPKGSFSFPYGAAALTRRLSEAKTQGKHAEEALAKEIQDNLKSAYRDLEIPTSLSDRARHDGGFTLYLSGGGFRGWGYVLLSQSSISPYPIPIINGFEASASAFRDTASIEQAAKKHSIFRISKRRAAQVPAVAFLVRNLAVAIPDIARIRFCQGGVREGHLFAKLPAEIRAMDPLLAASRAFAPPAGPHFAELMMASLPDGNDRRPPDSLTKGPVIPAFANLMFLQASYSKESASLAGLDTPISGVLAATHGVSHSARALLALLLCWRWAGDLPPPHDKAADRLGKIVGDEASWWCKYLGAVAGLIGEIYPAGKMGKEGDRVGLSAKWGRGGKNGDKTAVILRIKTLRQITVTESGFLDDALDGIGDVGKKKNRVAGEDGFGWAVAAELG